MIRQFSRSLIGLGFVSILLIPGQFSFADSFSCGQAVMKSASGVIGVKHTYDFNGICSENWTYGSGTSFTPLYTEEKMNTGYTIQIVGEATWDRATGASREVLNITGDVTGKRITTGTCPLDPFLKDNPEGSLPCSGMNVVLDITAGQPWTAMAKSQSFWFSKSMSVAAAQALSKLKQSAPDTQPPPPAPAPVKPDIPKVSAKDQNTPGDSTTAQNPSGISPSVLLKSRIPDVNQASTDAVQKAVSALPTLDEAERSALKSISSSSRSTSQGNISRGTGQTTAATQAPTGNAAGSTLPASGRAAIPQRTGIPTGSASVPDNQSRTSATTVRQAAAAMLLNVEAEDLAKSGKILVAGGQVTAQSMSGFGTGWSGDGQLFWSGGTVGAVLDLVIDVPTAATYALELYPTRAPDYGQVKIQVDGKDAPVTVDAYSPRVMQPAPRQLGRFSLSEGEHKISFMIVGKNPMASNYLFGIDRIRLYPSGPYAGASQ